MSTTPFLPRLHTQHFTVFAPTPPVSGYPYTPSPTSSTTMDILTYYSDGNNAPPSPASASLPSQEKYKPPRFSKRLRALSGGLRVYTATALTQQWVDEKSSGWIETVDLESAAAAGIQSARRSGAGRMRRMHTTTTTTTTTGRQVVEMSAELRAAMVVIAVALVVMGVVLGILGMVWGR